MGSETKTGSSARPVPRAAPADGGAAAARRGAKAAEAVEAEKGKGTTAPPIAAAPIAAPLIAADEPPPFEIVNPEGRAPFLLICDHASRAVPRALDRLGLDESALRLHIAWDIGAADIARDLAERFDARLLLAGYSRLIIDANRALDDPTSIPVLGEGTVVPANRGLGEADAAARAETFYWPYHRAVDAALDDLAARDEMPALVSIHTFTPVFKGVARPWHVGVLWDRDDRIARPLMARLGADPALVVGDNLPYSARLGVGFSIVHHAEARGLPHVLVEVRQDLVDTHHGAAEWAGRLGDALQEILADPALYRLAAARA